MQTAECIFTSIVVKLLIQGGHFTILGIGNISLKFRVGNRARMQETCIAFLLLHSKSPQMQLLKTMQHPSIAPQFPRVRLQAWVKRVLCQFPWRLKSRHRLELQSHLTLTALFQTYLGCWHYSVSCSYKLRFLFSSWFFAGDHSHFLETSSNPSQVDWLQYGKFLPKSQQENIPASTTMAFCNII